MAGMDEHNWAGNVTYGAARRHAPTGVDELQRVVAGASRVRVLGSRHSFNDIADTDGDLVSLAALPLRFELDPDPAAPTVTVSGGTRYGELAVALHAAGYALGNLASLPHISVAGACATATHGSGVTNANLAAAQRAVELVTADGERRTVTRADADFPALAVGLGAFGAVIAVTLAVERTYNVRQVVHEHLPLAEALAHFDEIMAGAYSVSRRTRAATVGSGVGTVRRAAPLGQAVHDGCGHAARALPTPGRCRPGDAPLRPARLLPQRVPRSCAGGLNGSVRPGERPPGR